MAAVPWLLGYLLQATMAVLNLIDWLLLRLLNKRLMSSALDDVTRKLTEGARCELKDPDVSAVVELTLDGLSKDKHLNFFGRLSQIRSIKTQLELRATIKATMKLYPSISAVPIRKPIFIIGLPRTGTTLLFNLLSMEPRFRAPMMWEMMQPLPPGRIDDWHNSKRYKHVARVMELHKMFTGMDIDQVHEVRIDKPEECYILFMRSFMAYSHFLCMPEMAAVADWFYSRGLDSMKKVYKLYKAQLQLLGYDHGMAERHFVMKSHIHNLCLEALLETFPDACLVFTHRDLRQVAPSFCSLNVACTSHLRAPDAGFGKRCLRLLAEIANRAASSLRKLEESPAGRNRVIFLKYTDLVQQPIATVRQIYDHFGFEMTIEETIEDYLRENPKGKHGTHAYSLADYGLTEEDVQKACASYVKYVSGK